MSDHDDMIMVGNAHGPAVLRALACLSGRKRPRNAAAVYASLLVHIEPDTGELRCTPHQLAEQAMVDLAEIEPTMLKLAELGVVVRDPRRTDDAWCINPHLAWCGSLQARARFAALVPPPAVTPLQSV